MMTFKPIIDGSDFGGCPMHPTIDTESLSESPFDIDETKLDRIVREGIEAGEFPFRYVVVDGEVVTE